MMTGGLFKFGPAAAMAASDVWDDGGCCDDKDEDDDDDDDAILPFSCLCHANAAHSRQSVFPVPVDSGGCDARLRRCSDAGGHPICG